MYQCDFQSPSNQRIPQIAPHVRKTGPLYEDEESVCLDGKFEASRGCVVVEVTVELASSIGRGRTISAIQMSFTELRVTA